MRISELIITAFNALKGNILRTLLTMLGIIIGISSVILIISLGQGATASITNEISSFGANLISVMPGAEQFGPGRGAASMLTLKHSDAQALAKAKIPGIANVSAQAGTRSVVIANGENVSAQISGVEPAYAAIQSLDVQTGAFFDQGQVDGLAPVAVVGPTIIKELFGLGAAPVGEVIKIDGKPFRVIGVLKTKGLSGFVNPDESIYLPITTVMKTLLGQDHIDDIVVTADSAEAVPQVMESIKSQLLDRHRIADPKQADFTIRSAQDAITTLGTVTGVLTALLSAIAAISLVVGGIGIMNIMLVTVTERTREIGLLKAIGAKRRDILAQFLIEAVVLTVSGGLLGMALGTLLSYVISSAINIPFSISITAIVLAVGVSSIVGIIFGLYPARKAAGLSPIDALRFE